MVVPTAPPERPAPPRPSKNQEHVNDFPPPPPISSVDATSRQPSSESSASPSFPEPTVIKLLPKSSSSERKSNQKYDEELPPPPPPLPSNQDNESRSSFTERGSKSGSKSPTSLERVNSNSTSKPSLYSDRKSNQKYDDELPLPPPPLSNQVDSESRFSFTEGRSSQSSSFPPTSEEQPSCPVFSVPSRRLATSFSFDPAKLPPNPQDGKSSPSMSGTQSPSAGPVVVLVGSSASEKMKKAAFSPVVDQVQTVNRTLDLEAQFGSGAQIFRAIGVDVHGQVALDPGVRYCIRTSRVMSEENLWASLKVAGLGELVNEPELALSLDELRFSEIDDFNTVLNKLSVPQKARFRRWFTQAKQTEQWTLVVAEPANNVREAQFFLEQAILYQQAHNLSAAVTLFEQAIAISPHFAIAYFYLAKCLAQLQQYTSAAAKYVHVIGLDAQHSEAHLALGILYATHLDRPVSDYQQCFTRALLHPERLSADSHSQALLHLCQSQCALSQWDEATHTLNLLKLRPPHTTTSTAVSTLTQQIQNKQSVPVGDVDAHVTPRKRIIEITYEEDSLHTIFLKMSSASPLSVICRKLLKLSLQMTETMTSSSLADVSRMQSLYSFLNPSGDTWTCTCDSSLCVRLSGTYFEGDACSTLTAKCFLFCGGKDVLLKLWAESLRRTFARGSSLPPSPQDSVSSKNSASVKKNVVAFKPFRSHSLSSVSETSDVDDDSAPSREQLLDLLIQVWVLRLIWRFGEMSRTDCLAKCNGQLEKQALVARLEEANVVVDAKGKKRIRFDISVETRFKKWRVGKRDKEVYEFYQSLTQAMKHAKSFKLLAVSGTKKTFGRSLSNDKSKSSVAAFLEDFTSADKYQQFLDEASPAALSLVDSFFSLNSNQYYQTLSRTVFAEHVLNVVKQCNEAKAQLSLGFLTVLFEIMVNESVESRPISEDDLPRLQDELMPQIDIGSMTSALFNTKNSVIVEPFVVPLIFEVFKCLPVGVVNGGLEYLTMLFLRNISNCALIFPSLTPGSMISSGWKSWLSYFVPHCFTWKTMDDGKSVTDGLMKEYQLSFQLSLHITILSIHHAFLTSAIPATEAFSFSSVLISILKTVSLYRLGDILEPAPVVVVQPEKDALSLPLSLDGDEISVSVIRTLLEGLLSKIIFLIGKFRDDHMHIGWTNLFQFLVVIQHLITCNPAASEVSSKPPIMLGPRKASLQAGKQKNVWEMYNSNAALAHSRLFASTTLQLVLDLLKALKLGDIDSSTTFGMQPHEISQVQAHKSQGLLFMEFFKKIRALTIYESESDEEDQGELSEHSETQTSRDATREAFVDFSNTRKQALDFLENGGNLIILIQRAEYLSAQETFISVSHGKNTFKTKVVKKTDCPSFDQQFVLTIKPAAQREDSSLTIRAYSQGISQKVIAEIILPLSYLEQYCEKAKSVKAQGATGPVGAWLNFQDKSSVSVSKPKSHCRLRYMLFFGPEHLPWGTLEVDDDLYNGQNGP